MLKRILALLAVACMIPFVSCDRKTSSSRSDGAGVDTPLQWLGGAGSAGTGTGPVGGPSPLPQTIIPDARIPQGTNPAVGVTIELLFDFNASFTDFAIMQTAFNAANNKLWQMTEGQIFIDTVNMYDSTTGSMTAASTLGTGFNPSAYDVVAYDLVNWDLAVPDTFHGAGYGRNGRLTAIPGTPAPPGTDGLLHELLRHIFNLSWRYTGMTNLEANLDDEFDFTPDDLDCIMELSASTTRLCYATNHLTSALSTPINTAQIMLIPPSTYLNGQPRSCWEQIMADYPGMIYTLADSTPYATPTLNFTINDIP